jgi:alpha-L-fucosidase
VRRRDFCTLLAATAASKALQSFSQIVRSEQPLLPEGFNQFVQDYAAYCAQDPEKRVFYKLVEGKVVQAGLDEASWKPSDWGNPPELPVPEGSFDGVPLVSPIPGFAGDGPYKPTWDSLLEFEAPEWYRDVKFAIWAHWSPQCVPEDGDWYGRNMYIESEKQYQYHRSHYGPQSQIGYKDLCAKWTLEKWDPKELIARYQKAGARIFIALANHHDGFDCWDSRYHPWNSVALGPRRDVVGGWAAEARKQGMRFGVTVHQARNWWWFQPAHDVDHSGSMKGVPYDGALTAAQGNGQWWNGLDPQRLYGVKHPIDALPDIAYVKNFYDRTRDLIDRHNPDLVYFDNAGFPLGWAGMNLAAYLYNKSLRENGGRTQAVVTIKRVADEHLKAVVADYERGGAKELKQMVYPWQSETCIGGWHYDRKLYEQGDKYGWYLNPGYVVHWLIDIVSKNGTFVLNIPGRPDGTIDSKEIAVLDGITAWMQTNSEAIYDTRPWKVYGEGPTNLWNRQGYYDLGGVGPTDIRFTRNKANNVIYALTLGWPSGPILVKSLGLSAPTQPGKIAKVEFLGTGESVQWSQRPEGLKVEMPKHFHPQADYSTVLKVTLV